MDQEYAVAPPSARRAKRVLERLEQAGILFHRSELGTPGTDTLEIEVSALSANHAFDVHKVAWASSDEFVDDEMLGRARAKYDPWAQQPVGRIVQRFDLEWKRSEREIEGDSTRCAEQQDAMVVRKRSCVGHPGLEALEQGVDHRCLAAVWCQHRHIDISRDSRLAPPGDSHAPDQAGAVSRTIEGQKDLYCGCDQGGPLATHGLP